MKEDLLEIRQNLKAGRFANEAAVSVGIVQRLLSSLEWPVFDPGVVAPEYSLEGRRVDYALCNPSDIPIVLIEVKHVGKGKGADRQLFEYAFHAGVPMVILTDGQEWSFFLPAERGHYEERRLYKIDILERDPAEAAGMLERYLGYRNVCSGEAIESAQRDYRDAARKRDAKKALPDAWQRLIESEDEILVDLISEKVEDLCGVKPDFEAVVSFLHDRSESTTTLTSKARKPVAKSSRGTQRIPSKNSEVRRHPRTLALDFVGFSLFGEIHKCRNAIEVLEGIFRSLDERDSGFLERFANHPKPSRWKRPYLARSRDALYPGKPELARSGYGRELVSGWWIDTNLDNAKKATLIEMACDVADIRRDRDLRFSFG